MAAVVQFAGHYLARDAVYHLALDQALQGAGAVYRVEAVDGQVLHRGRRHVQRDAALGQPFDPDMHNAVMKTTEGEPGLVTEVFEKGYRVKGRMIRYAMVKIAVEE